MKSDLFKKNIWNSFSTERCNDVFVLEATYIEKQLSISKKEMSKNYFAFHLIVEGTGVLYVGDTEYKLKENDIWIRFPNEKLKYYGTSAKFRYFYICFGGLLIDWLFAKLNISKTERIKESNEIINKLFSDCITTSAKERHGLSFNALGHLYLIFAQLYNRQYLISSNNLFSNQEKYIRLAKEYIDKNYTSPELSAAAVAKYLGLNTDYFARLFKKYLNYTFSNYLIELRLKNAVAIMKSSHDITISGISESVGYTDCSYFSYSFKKMYSVSPKTYYAQLKHKPPASPPGTANPAEQ